MAISLNPGKYATDINMLEGVKLTSAQAQMARQPNVRHRFFEVVDAVEARDARTLGEAMVYLGKVGMGTEGYLGPDAVLTILRQIQPDLVDKSADIMAASIITAASTASDSTKLVRAFDNVAAMLRSGPGADATRAALKATGLTITDVAYVDGHRISGVSGDDIADLRLKAFKPDARRAYGAERATTACPIVKDSNWDGPFGVIDLAAFKVRNKDGNVVSLADIIENPAAHINGYNGPRISFYDAGTDVVTGSGKNAKGPKAAVMDCVVPAADGTTDTVPTIYTYGKPKLILVAVPGEGVSAHYTDGSRTINLSIHKDGAEKALGITRQQFSSKQGPTSFDKGTSAVDDMLINSALIVQIPVNDPDVRPRRRGGFMSMSPTLESFGGATKGVVLESLGGATRGATRSATRSLDTGHYGTEAGIVSAGGNLGSQQSIPQRITRARGDIRIDFILQAATDSEVIGEALALRMRSDVDAIIAHPACKRAGVEN